MRPFTQPADPQLSSPPLNLPSEVRLQIWTLLLKSPDTLVTKAEYEHHERRKQQEATSANDNGGSSEEGTHKYRLCSNLSAQLLACCQQVYNECEPILYRENTISIFCASVKVDHFYFDLLCFALDQEWLLPDSAQEEDVTDFGDKTVFQALSRFHKYRLSMSVHYPEAIYLFGRFLAATLSNKEVTVEAFDGQYRPVVAQWLKSLQSLKCKSMDFESYNPADTERSRL